jgi:ribosome-associated translation inhibitor RaiA
MQVQVTTGHRVEGSQRLIQHVEDEVTAALERFGNRITRVEVHFTDENGHTKSTGTDKRCAVEARLAGLPPLAVSHQAATLEQALGGAIEKLERSLDHTLGRLKDGRLRELPRP